MSIICKRGVAIGGFKLPEELEPGEWRDLTAGEISRLAEL